MDDPGITREVSVANEADEEEINIRQQEEHESSASSSNRQDIDDLENNQEARVNFEHDPEHAQPSTGSETIRQGLPLRNISKAYSQDFSQTALQRLHYLTRPELIVTENLRESLAGDIPPRKLGDDLEEWIPVRWFMFLNTFPIIATSMGPFANLCSLVAIADVWRRNMTTMELPKDLPWVYAINAVSLASGCFANVALFLQFSQTVSFVPLEIIAVFGYYFAAFSLLTLIVITQFVYFGSGEYQRFQGYWFGAIACGLYFFGAILLTVNDIALLRGMKLQSKSLTQMQKRIIILNVLLMVWIALGGAVFGFLTNNVFGSGVYFALSVCLTVAYGDIVPINNLGRALIIPYAWIGVMLIGLTIAAIVNAFKEIDGISMVYRRIESRRTRLYSKLAQSPDSEKLTPKQTFEMMRHIAARQQSHSEVRTIFTSILVFSVFWLIGSLVFSYTETTWSYFDAIYFSGLSFVTNGFGDFTPKSPGGRAFYTAWAMFALPMITSLISALNDKVFQRVIQWFDDFASTLVNLVNRMGIRNKRMLRLRQLRKVHGIHVMHVTPAHKMEQEIHEMEKQVPGDEQGEHLNPQDADAMDHDQDNDITTICTNATDASFEKYKVYDFQTRARVGGADAPSPLGYRRSSRKSTVQRLFADWPEKLENIPAGQVRARRMMVLTSRIREFAYQSVRDPDVTYGYDDWNSIMELTNLDLNLQTASFWISEKTPLRAPIKEPTFFLLTCLTALQQDIIALAKEEHASNEASTMTTQNN